MLHVSPHSSYASEQMFQAFFMAMDEGAILQNSDGEVVAVNRAAQTLLGSVATELFVRPSGGSCPQSSFINQDGVPISWDQHPTALAFQTGKPQRDVLLGRRQPDGKLVWLSVNAQPLASDTEAAPSAVVSTFRDVTQHHLTERYEQFRSQTLELLAAGAPLHDLLEGIVRGVEKLQPEVICSILLMENDGKHLGQGIAPSLPVFYKTEIDGLEIGRGVGCCGTAAATGQRCIAEDLQTHPYWSHFQALADRIGMRACWSEPIRSSTSQVLGTFAVYHREVYSPEAFDITLIEKSARLVSIAIERKRMEQEVAAREQEYRSLAETSPDFIIRYDREGRILYVNDLLQKRLGLAGAQEVIGKHPSEAWPDGRFAQIENAAARAVANANQVDIELAEQDASGAPRFSQLFIVPERDVNGHIVGTISFGRDITAIRQSERRLKHFIESLPGMAYTFKRSADGHASFPYASPAIAEIYGLKPEDVKDDMTPIHLLAHPDDRPRIETAIAESERTMTPLRVESRICRPGQPERWVDVRSVPEKQLDGSILRHGIMLDITERKRIENTLYFIAQRGWQDSAENFFDALAQYLGETLGVEHVIIDKLTETPGIVETVALFAKGSIVANIRYQITGTPCENVMKRKFCCYPTGVQNLFPNDKMLAEMGAQSYAGLPLWDSTGQPIGLIAVLDSKPLSDEGEISSVLQLVAIRAAAELERARSDRLLRESEREFRTLAENLPDVLVRYDRECRRTYVNHSLGRNFPVIPEQLIGKTLEETDANGLPMPEIYRNALRHTLATGERSEFEMQMPLRDGNIGIGLCFLVAKRSANGQICGAISIGHDISERKRYEAELEQYRHHLEKLVEERTRDLSVAKETAEAATRAKSHFLAAASHDLRQPLQAIGLFNQALAMTGLDERQKTISNNLTKSVNCLSELLNKLLDLSRLDAGIIQPHSVVIPATDLLEMIRTEFDALCQKKGLRLHLFCSQRDLSLFSDLNLLMTLVRNLVSNAQKYTAQGGVLVSIRKRKDHALIQVWDTGIGIAPELMDSIFEEYFQIANPQRDRTKGVGLGLTIVKRLSNLLRLELRVRSRVGKGSVFELGVPLAGQSNTPMATNTGASHLETISPTYLLGKRFVVVEDDAPAAESINLALEMAGAQVTHFGTAEDALSCSQIVAADYYISDYRLPGMNGLQLLDAIQARSTQTIKAVLLTGNTSPDQFEPTHAYRWKVLFKPVDLSKLLTAIGL